MESERKSIRKKYVKDSEKKITEENKIETNWEKTQFERSRSGFAYSKEYNNSRKLSTVKRSLWLLGAGCHSSEVCIYYWTRWTVK